MLQALNRLGAINRRCLRLKSERRTLEEGNPKGEPWKGEPLPKNESPPQDTWPSGFALVKPKRGLAFQRRQRSKRNAATDSIGSVHWHPTSHRANKSSRSPRPLHFQRPFAQRGRNFRIGLKGRKRSAASGNRRRGVSRILRRDTSPPLEYRTSPARQCGTTATLKKQDSLEPPYPKPPLFRHLACGGRRWTPSTQKWGTRSGGHPSCPAPFRGWQPIALQERSRKTGSDEAAHQRVRTRSLSTDPSTHRTSRAKMAPTFS